MTRCHTRQGLARQGFRDLGIAVHPGEGQLPTQALLQRTAADLRLAPGSVTAFRLTPTEWGLYHRQEASS